MPTIAQVKQQVDRIWYASFQSNLTSSVASELRRQALLGVKAALEAALVEERRLIVFPSETSAVRLNSSVPGPIRRWRLGDGRT